MKLFRETNKSQSNYLNNKEVAVNSAVRVRFPSVSGGGFRRVLQFIPPFYNLLVKTYS